MEFRIEFENRERVRDRVRRARNEIRNEVLTLFWNPLTYLCLRLLDTEFSLRCSPHRRRALDCWAHSLHTQNLHRTYTEEGTLKSFHNTKSTNVCHQSCGLRQSVVAFNLPSSANCHPERVNLNAEPSLVLTLYRGERFRANREHFYRLENGADDDASLAF